MSANTMRYQLVCIDFCEWLGRETSTQEERFWDTEDEAIMGCNDFQSECTEQTMGIMDMETGEIIYRVSAEDWE